MNSDCSILNVFQRATCPIRNKALSSLLSKTEREFRYLHPCNTSVTNVRIYALAAPTRFHGPVPSYNKIVSLPFTLTNEINQVLRPAFFFMFYTCHVKFCINKKLFIDDLFILFATRFGLVNKLLKYNSRHRGGTYVRRHQYDPSDFPCVNTAQVDCRKIYVG